MSTWDKQLVSGTRSVKNTRKNRKNSQQVIYEFFKDPDWRWTAVTAFIKEKQLTGRWDNDDLFNRTVAYVRQKQSGKANAPWLSNYPDIGGADRLHTASGDERWIIEALIISGDTNEEICQYCGIPLDLLEAYEGLFFDVRSYLGARGLIHGRVIRKSSDLPQNDRDSYWKLIAYIGGPTVIRNFIERGSLPDAVFKKLKAITKGEHVRGHHHVIATMPVNQYNATEVAKLHLEHDKVEVAQQQLAGGGDNQHSQAFTDMLTGVVMTTSQGMAITRTDADTVDEPRDSVKMLDALKENGVNGD